MKNKIIITRYDGYETVEYNNCRVLYWDCDIDRKIYEQQKQSFINSHAPCEIRFLYKENK
jgi:hypothetical protein